MGISIEEMKLVDSTRAQLDQLSIQVANREAGMKRDAANAALIQFKTYFANREFTLTGNDWNVTATHGSIVFALAIKNAPTGGPECLILKFPEMVKKPQLTIFLEPQPGKPVENKSPAVEAAKGPLAEVLDKVARMREKLAEPPKKWIYYSLKQQATAPSNPPSQREEYMSFGRLLEMECP